MAITYFFLFWTSADQNPALIGQKDGIVPFEASRLQPKRSWQQSVGLTFSVDSVRDSVQRQIGVYVEERPLSGFGSIFTFLFTNFPAPSAIGIGFIANVGSVFENAVQSIAITTHAASDVFTEFISSVSGELAALPNVDFSSSQGILYTLIVIFSIFKSSFLRSFSTISSSILPNVFSTGFSTVPTEISSVLSNIVRREPPDVFSTHFLPASDYSLALLGNIGLVLSIIAFVFAARAGSGVWFGLWWSYFSILKAGEHSQFFSYGWESQALETGLICIFFCDGVLPVLPDLGLFLLPGARKKNHHNQTSSHGTSHGYLGVQQQVCLWLLRWLIFRISLGAGLIKFRGDSCWDNGTCLWYFFFALCYCA